MRDKFTDALGTLGAFAVAVALVISAAGCAGVLVGIAWRMAKVVAG